MRLTTPITAASFVALTLAAAPAFGQSFKVDKVELNGVTSVPKQPLLDGLKIHPGDTVTTDQVLADQDVLTHELEQAHVTGGVKTSLRNKSNGHKDVIYAVNDTGVAKPVVTTTALHVAHVTFVGNQFDTPDDLTAAAALKPGDVVTDQVLTDATTRVANAYKKAAEAKAKDPGKTTVAPQVTYPQPGQVDIAFTFTQTTNKKKQQRNTEDEGGFHTE